MQRKIKHKFVVGTYGELSDIEKLDGATGQSAGYPVFQCYMNDAGRWIKHTCAWFVQDGDARKFCRMQNSVLKAGGSL